MKCGINIILRLLLWYFYYGNGKSKRGTVIVIKTGFLVSENHRGRCICNTTNTAVVFFVMGRILFRRYVQCHNFSSKVVANYSFFLPPIQPIAKNTTNISQIYHKYTTNIPQIYHKSTTKCDIVAQKCDIVPQNRVFYYIM